MAFRKILIANRGEIACRIIRTAQKLGFATVAIHSETDATARHVLEADEAVAIGGAHPSESYLNIAAVIGAARQTGAEAIHPGYGFLAENAAFAEAVIGAALSFIGPSPEAIAAMGDKAEAKRQMIAAGVPTIPGYEGENQSDERLTAEAKALGLPLMIKAAAGGGGRGLRHIAHMKDFAIGLAAARREAMAAFGNDALMIERALDQSRHVEVQILADRHGNTLSLGERDCSLQRRHQKVIEEAPAPRISRALRTSMSEAAVKAAQTVGYVGAGTIEFLLQNESFYFLEMNTRIQVEHPVTEAITGLDLVEWQFRVAAGETLPFRQRNFRFSGHAIEARLYAEDWTAGFLPQSGTLLAFKPPEDVGIRIDHDLAEGKMISPHYDPMLAKVIAHGRDRDDARRRLVAALEDLIVFGPTTNRDFLIALLQTNEVAAAATTTRTLEDKLLPEILAHRKAPSQRVRALAAVLLFDEDDSTRWGERGSWQSGAALSWPLRLMSGESHEDLTISLFGPDTYRVSLAGDEIEIRILRRDGYRLSYDADGIARKAAWLRTGSTLRLSIDGMTHVFRDALRDPPRPSDTEEQARLIAPTSGRVVAVLAAAGAAVKKGQAVIVVEAMKMHHQIAAGRDGIIERIMVKEGDQVEARQVIAALAEA